MSIYKGTTLLAGTPDITNKANTSLDNLTSTGKNIGNWSTNVSNCITEIPQDIKLELNNGTLTLKAGSKVYVPNGAGTFNTVTINSDLSTTRTTSSSTKWFVFYTGSGITTYGSSAVFSGTTAPSGVQYMVWYDTTNNLVKYTSDSGSTWSSGYGLPVGTIMAGTGGIESVNEIFNGFGYIYSTIFALPGVKGLTPNGRNADGTLNSIDFTVENVLTTTNSVSANCMIVLKNNFIETYKDTAEKPTSGFGYYDADENYLYASLIHSDCCIAGYCKRTSGVVSDFQPKKAFRTVDWNDKRAIAGWGMPSHRYTNLTLGATEASYQAPANGWFVLNKEATGGGQYVNMRNNSNGIQTGINSSGSAQHLCAVLPCLKGDSMVIGYSAAGTIHVFRFVYAEGENNV